MVLSNPNTLRANVQSFNSFHIGNSRLSKNMNKYDLLFKLYWNKGKITLRTI